MPSAVSPRVGGDLAGEPGQAEVEDLDLAAGRPHQVLRLDVAVDHAVLEGVLQAQRRLAGVLARLADRQRPAAIDQPGQVGPLDELHDQHVRLPGLLGVVGGHDVRVRSQARGRLDLAAEPLDQRRVAQQVAADDLEGDRPVHQPMLGPVDGPHAAGAEGGDDPVARVVVQLLGQPGEAGGSAAGSAGRSGRGGGLGIGPTTNDDGTWKPDGGSTADSSSATGAAPIAAPRPRSFATSESSGWSRIHRQHESQEDRCCSISSISGSSSRP